MSKTRLLVFAKAPASGLAKTRLIPALGPEGAARLAGRLLTHALTQALVSAVGPVELWASPAFDAPAWRGFSLPAGVSLHLQGEGDLGARMARAVINAPEQVATASVLLTGADCPALDALRLQAAADALTRHEAAMYPALDGGYVLLGLKRFHASLFEDMPWSTPDVANITLERMRLLGWRVWLGEALPDIDRAEDLRHLPAG